MRANSVCVHLLPVTGAFSIQDATQVRQLVDTLRADRAWLKEHTRLSERARMWAASDRSVDWLLRGAELEAAEQWRDRQPAESPRPGAPVLDLIHASRLQAGEQPAR